MSDKELTETEKYRIAIDALKAIHEISYTPFQKVYYQGAIDQLREGLAEALAQENRKIATNAPAPNWEVE